MHASYCHLWLIRLYCIFPNHLINIMIFEKKKEKVIVKKMCFDFLYKVCLKHFSLKGDMSHKLPQMYISLPSCKVLIIVVTCQWHINFLNRFSKNSQIQNSMKIPLVAAMLFHANGRTLTHRQTNGRYERHEEADSRLSQFYSSAKKRILIF